MIRLFIALDLPKEVKTYLSQIIEDMKSKGANVKWVKADNIHLTMKFLGNTEPSKVDSIIESLNKAIHFTKPIETNLSLLGGFPNLTKPRVIWIDIEKNRELIINTAKDIESTLIDIGFEIENKKFTPHLTLGRVKDLKNFDNLDSYLQNLQLKSFDFNFESLSLIKSTLTQHGPIYKKLHTIQFSERFGD